MVGRCPKPRQKVRFTHLKTQDTLDMKIRSLSLYPSRDEADELRVFIKFCWNGIMKGNDVQPVRTGAMVFKKGITREQGVGFFPKAGKNFELREIFRALKEKLILTVEFADAHDGFGTQTVNIVSIRG